MKSEYDHRVSIERPPLGLFVVVPYILFSEIYFFRQKRYFIILKQLIVGVLALRDDDDTIYVSSLAVSPFFRKIGVATNMLNYAAVMANRLHKNAVELSVVKANTPALSLYLKYGFRKKTERRRSFLLRKDVKTMQ
jgi:ribosomal protein S18 acetylase RimI-like enzyme